jgi:hypothetical protein
VKRFEGVMIFDEMRLPDFFTAFRFQRKKLAFAAKAVNRIAVNERGGKNFDS